MESKEKVLKILKQNTGEGGDIDDKEIKRIIMRMPCKKDSEKVIIELYLLSKSLEEAIEEVEVMQRRIDIDEKLKGVYEGVNMIAGLRRDTEMVKDGLARVKEKIERG